MPDIMSFKIKIPLVAAGLWLTACTPEVLATSASEGFSEGSESGASESGPTSSATATSAGEPTSASTSGDSSEPSDPYYDYCGCELYTEYECEYCGQVGVQECVFVDADECGFTECQVECPCYDDYDCEEGKLCDDMNACVPVTPIPVCERQPLTLTELPLQGAPAALTLADLDGDGALDLVAALDQEGRVEVALGDGAGGFLPGTTYPSGLSPGAQRIAVADLDGDGSVDLAVTSPTPIGELSLLFGQAGVFPAPVLQTIGQGPEQLWSGDFDGDGHPDLLARHGDVNADMSLRTGDGLGGFAAAVVLADPGDNPLAVAVGAVAGDDRRDIVTTAHDWHGARIFEYAAGQLAPAEFLSGSGSHAMLAVGDIDGDQRDDVVGQRTIHGLHLIQTWPNLIAAPEFATQTADMVGPIADVDGDGRGDLVTTDAVDPTVRVIFLDGPCSQAHEVPGPTTPALLAAGDLDGDGKADIVAGQTQETGAVVLRSGP
ncbi:FG-GAP repeat domain-containing protein [Nannocystis radixulma]|uniref:VCBS repeat-containing protein n=1 Tax=Nannocystis radixulma TaxID=2995305 RepID=A0ABT5BP27_9BACT|nr:VCBS repeat-containing protein [Nannocystis radixulma]MDC0675924.1 VCBS repeat-containing protein [Nannocystis radixulma]